MRFDRFIEGTRSVMNTDFQPISVFYATLYENKDLSPFLASFFENIRKSCFQASYNQHTSFSFLIVSRKKRNNRDEIVGLCILGKGFSGMIIELMLIFCFQAMYGYVFSWIGMLLATFMGGLGSGSILVAQARRR
jgi:spermidine synthase